MAGKTIPEGEIVKALRDSAGNQRKAAETLKTSQAWLTRWLAKNGYERRITWEKKGGAA